MVENDAELKIAKERLRFMELSVIEQRESIARLKETGQNTAIEMELLSILEEELR